MGFVEKDILERAEMIMRRIDAKVEDRPVVIPARRAAEEAREKCRGNEGIFCGASVQLKDGTIITGKNSSLVHAGSSLILNATKHLAKLPDHMHLIPENVIGSLAVLKKEVL